MEYNTLSTVVQIRSLYVILLSCYKKGLASQKYFLFNNIPYNKLLLLAILSSPSPKSSHLRPKPKPEAVPNQMHNPLHPNFRVSKVGVDGSDELGGVPHPPNPVLN